jgi:thymidylate synthase (FAD)
MKTTNVLNKGFITLIAAPENGDLTVVNAARVSFNKSKDELDSGDAKLIEFLVKNKHDSPLRHVNMTFRVKAPEFVMRQWYKHVVGIAYTVAREPDHAWNEVSGRYVEYDEEFYYPETFRKQSKNNKQATTCEEIDGAAEARLLYAKTIDDAYKAYKSLLSIGVGREIARTVLPLSFYTEVIWTASLQAILNFISLRDHDGSQHEIRVYALALRELIKDVVPETMKAWETHRT